MSPSDCSDDSAPLFACFVKRLLRGFEIVVFYGAGAKLLPQTIEPVGQASEAARIGFHQNRGLILACVVALRKCAPREIRGADHCGRRRDVNLAMHAFTLPY